VKAPPYSSLAAFLAHYRTLREAVRSDEERELLATMENVIEGLHPSDRAALLDTGVDSGATRRRQRAERSLRQLLAERGILQG
jgi:hypothetical protein